MPKNQQLPYLLCYDIADPKRLGRVHKIATENGQPIQYSVFLIYKTDEQLDQLVKELTREIEPKEDDIRIYPLNNPSTATTLGHPVQLDGVYLINPEVKVEFAPYGKDD